MGRGRHFEMQEPVSGCIVGCVDDLLLTAGGIGGFVEEQLALKAAISLVPGCSTLLRL